MPKINFNMPDDIDEVIIKYQDAHRERKLKRINKDEVLVLICRKGLKAVDAEAENLMKEFKEFYA